MNSQPLRSQSIRLIGATIDRVMTVYPTSKEETHGHVYLHTEARGTFRIFVAYNQKADLWEEVSREQEGTPLGRQQRRCCECGFPLCEKGTLLHIGC